MKKFRKIRRLLVAAFVLVLIAGGGLFVKNLALRQIRSRLENSVHYSRLRLTVIPPALILEDVRSVSASPFFTAQRVVLQISYLSLFKRDKPLTVIVDKPVLRIYGSTPSGPPKKIDLRLPFSVENGFIRDGEVFFWSSSVSVRTSKLRAFFRQSEDRFVLQAQAAENTIFFASMSHPFSGQLRAVVEGTGNDLRLHQLTFEGKSVLARARGVLSNINDLSGNLRLNVRTSADLLAEYLDLPFEWAGPLEGEGTVIRAGGVLSIKADLASSGLVLSGILLGRVEGGLTFRQGEPATLNLAVRDPRRAPEFVDLTFGNGQVEGRARSVHVDPILKDIRIPWPVRSPATGTFVVDHKGVTVKAAFEDDPSMPEAGGRYPVRGPVDLVWDKSTKTVTFSSPKLETGFAVLRAEGRVSVGRDLEVTMTGGVTDVKRGREFVGLVLPRAPSFPEIRGRGTAEIKILGAFRHPQVKFVFSLVQAGFDTFEANGVDGLTEIAGGEVTGFFKINDPEMRGEVRLQTRDEAVEVDARLDDGPIERILTSLDVALPLKGKAAGQVNIIVAGRDVQVRGHASSPGLDLGGVRLKDVETGLEWRKSTKEIALTKLKAGLFGGTVGGDGRFAISSRDFDVDLEGTGFDLGSLVPDLSGHARIRFQGRGSLQTDQVRGSFAVTSLRYGTMGPADASGTLAIGFRDDTLTVQADGKLDPGGSDFSVAFTYPDAERSYLVHLKGRLLNPDLVLPWKGIKAEVGYLLDIRGPGGGPSARIDGVVDLKGTLLPFPGFPHALTDFSGLVRIQNNKASLRSFQGRLAGGEVQAGGDVRLGKDGLEFIDVRADGKNLSLALLDKTRTLADGSLHLEGDGGRLALSGEFLIRQLSWRREFSEKFIFSAAPSGPKTQRNAIDAMGLDIHLRADDNVLIENSLGKIQARFDLTLSGTVEAPVLLGEIEGLRGDILFQDRKFRLVQARVGFFNPTSFEPYLDVRAETFLKDYRVTISASGPLDRLRPEFSSAPPLPPEDVLALLALGESFKRTYQYDASTQMGTGSLLSFQLAEDAKKRAEKLFNLDSFRIDPFVLGASTEMTARLTVGKKISRNIILLYSTNLTSQREELVRLEWEFSGSFSLVAMRDERGRLSLDAKIRKRF
jgi:hypothetical protein